MKFIKTDLKRIFTEPAFYLSLIICLASITAGIICNYGGEQLFLKAQSLALPFIAPLLAAMPYSVMIMTEKETGVDNLIFVKSGRFGYKYRRFFTCGIAGAAVLFIPEFILFIIAFLMNMYISAHNILVLFLSFTFGFAYAVFAYALTFVNKKKYVPLVMPEVLYLLCTYAFPNIGLDRYYPPLDISPAIYGGEVCADRLLIPSILTLSALVLITFGKEGERR